MRHTEPRQQKGLASAPRPGLQRSVQKWLGHVQYQVFQEWLGSSQRGRGLDLRMRALRFRRDCG